MAADPAPPFSMKTHQAGDTLVVEAFGELDISEAKRFEAELREALGGGPPVLLDLSGVEFIDSSGLRALILLSEEARSDGDNLRIRSSLSPAVKRLFDLSGVEDGLPWVTDT